jgi:DNA-binding CsgD family transcriptional regulator
MEEEEHDRGVPGMTFADRSARLLADIYAAAIDPDRWQETLRRLIEAAGAESGRLILAAPNPERRHGRAYVFGAYTEAMHRAYKAYYHALDPRPAVLTRLPVGAPMASHHHFDEAFMARNEFCTDFVLRNGGRYSLSYTLAREPGLHAELLLTRPARPGPFDEQEIESFARFVPHLQNAARIGAVAARWDQLGRFAVASLDESNKGVVIVDRESRVVHMNAVASRLIARGDGILLRDHALIAAKASERAKLARLIGATTELGPDKPPQRVDLAISRVQNRVPYLLTLAPLMGEPRLSALDSGLPGARALVIIVDPMTDDGHTHRRLIDVFGLTRAEARLGAALLQSKSIAAIAQETGLGIPTLRTQLRGILKKTGAARQSEFVRIATPLASTGADQTQQADQNAASEPADR